MLILSYALNLLILLPLLAGFAMQPAQMDTVFGPDTDARRILICLYATIALASGAGLFLMIAGRANLALTLGVSLFAVQITYKLLTIPLVGWDSPIVKTNTRVVIIHTMTLLSIWRKTQP